MASPRKRLSSRTSNGTSGSPPRSSRHAKRTAEKRGRSSACAERMCRIEYRSSRHSHRTPRSAKRTATIGRSPARNAWTSSRCDDRTGGHSWRPYPLSRQVVSEYADVLEEGREDLCEQAQAVPVRGQGLPQLGEALYAWSEVVSAFADVMSFVSRGRLRRRAGPHPRGRRPFATTG
jgi:hypothetical protein